MKSSARTRSFTSFARLVEQREVGLDLTRGASGRCTLTATRLPFGSVARCTWPIDAAATGVVLELEEEPLDRAAELLDDHPLRLLERERTRRRPGARAARR